MKRETSQETGPSAYTPEEKALLALIILFAVCAIACGIVLFFASTPLGIITSGVGMLVFLTAYIAVANLGTTT